MPRIRSAMERDRRGPVRPTSRPWAALSRTPLGVQVHPGGRQPGVFASLDPRLMSVTPIGVGAFSAPHRHQTTSREPGPPCPAAGCPAENPRAPGGGLHLGSARDSTARNSIGHPFTHRSRGAGVVFGPPTGGVRFARPPANVCDPSRGRRIVSATSSPDDIAATRTSVSDVSARWVPIHHKPFRGNEFTVHPKLPWRGLRNEPGVERRVTRPQPTAALREGCQNAGFVESIVADDRP